MSCCTSIDCYGTPNPKLYFDLLLFHLAQGFTRTQKTLKIPNKGLKTAHKKMLLDIFKKFIWNKICSFFSLKAKNEDKLKNIFFKTIFLIKNWFFAIFEEKKLKNLWFLILFLASGLWCKRKVHINFQKKKYSFSRFLWFYKNENFAVRAPRTEKFADFLELNS